MNLSKLMPNAALLFALAAPGTPAFAQDDPKPDCSNQLTQFDMNYCANEDFEAADAKLNEVWKHARVTARKLDEQEEDVARRGAEKALLAAQRGWIAYRDGSCELAGWEAHGGSMEPMLVSGCLAQMTIERTRQLQALVTEYQP